MNDMVERVARAIAPMAWNSVNAGDTAGQKNRRKASLKHARAAIEAMRQPTDEMKVAAVVASAAQNKPVADRLKARDFSAGISSELTAGDSRVLVAGWQAMIDAALSHQNPQPDIAEGVPRIDDAH